jgi:amino acid adenylation domain-containing protein
VIRSGNVGPEDEWVRELPDRVLTHIDAKDEQGTTPRDGSPNIATDPQLGGDDPAYLFFTSGTTGVPKAVVGCHKGLSHFLSWQRDTFQVTPLDRCAQLIGLSFDAVLRDIFLPLTSGATLCLPEANREPESLMVWMQSQQVTLVHTVPAVAHNWISQIRKEVALPSLRWVFFSGEPLRDTLIRQWRLALPGKYQIVNLYGPTETTLIKCFFVVPDPPLPGIQPVGRPLPETQAWVTNSKDQLCGLGEIGEIALRTPFRTLGYANSRLETARHFRRNPFRKDDGDLVYFTGDLGRYRPDGSLDILGRRDHQVKIRGVRIELDEIAAIICKHPEVSASVVVFRKQVEPQDLVAYVVPKNFGLALREELRAHLASQLPAAMIPTVFVFLESMPLTANGKVDRKALPVTDFMERAPNKEHVAPRSAIELQLATVWSEVLGVSNIGAFDNFFDLGGQSLLATQVASRIQRDLRVECPLRLLFETPNLAALALILGHRLQVPSEPKGLCAAKSDSQRQATLAVETKQGI